MFVSNLSAAKQFSLVTQKSDIDIISIVDSVESTKRNYKKLLRKFEADAEKIFALPTLKSVIDAIERDEERAIIHTNITNVTQERNSI